VPPPEQNILIDSSGIVSFAIRIDHEPADLNRSPFFSGRINRFVYAPAAHAMHREQGATTDRRSASSSAARSMRARRQIIHRNFREFSL
jgi:hypothetical protein